MRIKVSVAWRVETEHGAEVPDGTDLSEAYHEICHEIHDLRTEGDLMEAECFKVKNLETGETWEL